MAARTSRLELRADPERERRIRFAAELSHQSVSAFVLDAAGEKAERVITASTATSVPSEFFGQLWEALDVWLQRHARHAQSMRTARTFVSHAGDDLVVAYFSLAAVSRSSTDRS